MSIKKYEIFLKTVDLGSLTKASQILGYTQSAISHIIAGLEDELGIKLLIRGRAGVRLTEEGHHLIPAIRTICLDNQELLRQVSELHGLETGTIRIGTILSVSIHLLPMMIRAFSEQHPNIDFELLQGNYEDIEQWISEGRIDCGFLRLPTNEVFETILIVKEKFLAIFPENRKLEEERFRFDYVKAEPYILRPDTLDDDLSKVLKKAAYRPKITYSAKDDYAVMAMVEQGLGMSILPELLMKGTTYQLQKMELDPPVFREICLAYKKVQNLSPVAKQFISYVKNSFAYHIDP
jgi:DNA-binding transcriptional LysR family regulator